MTQQQLVAALSMDLYRWANSLYSKSYKVAEVFEKEARKRHLDLMAQERPPYLNKLLVATEKYLQDNHERKHENILMVSIQLRNYASKTTGLKSR